MSHAKAAWGEMDITPPLGLLMGGRGPRYTVGTAVLSPLLGQLLLLEDVAGRRTLWVSLDLIGLTFGVAASLRAELSAYTGVPYEAVIINCSHTHSGPLTIDDELVDWERTAALQAYQRDLTQKVLALACHIRDALQPVTLAVHRSTSDVGINRRGKDAAGAVNMTPNPDGARVPDVWILDVRARAGDGRAVVFNYGCHPVIVYGYAYDGLSADYPGVARRQLRQALGQHVHCQFIQGFAGDVRPRVLADLAAGRFRKATPADPEQAGATLAADVLAGLHRPGEPLAAEFKAAGGWFPVRRDLTQVPSVEQWRAQMNDAADVYRNVGAYWSRRLETGLPLARGESWEIGLLQLAPGQRVAWFAGEAVAEWLAHLRGWLGDERLTGWAYCQGMISYYLPTDELLPEGGYEVVGGNHFNRLGPAPLAPGLNDAARAAFVALARRLDGAA